MIYFLTDFSKDKVYKKKEVLLVSRPALVTFEGKQSLHMDIGCWLYINQMIGLLPKGDVVRMLKIIVSIL